MKLLSCKMWRVSFLQSHKILSTHQNSIVKEDYNYNKRTRILIMEPAKEIVGNRTPTYLQYDDDTVAHLSFSSDAITIEAESEEKQIEHSSPKVASIIARNQPLGFRACTFLRNARKKVAGLIVIPRVLPNKNKIGNSKVLKGFFKRMRLEMRNKRARRKLENEFIKSSGSFRSKKGFLVEVSSEECCLEQFEDSSVEQNVYITHQ